MSATDIDGRNSEPAEATSRYGLYDPSADRDSCGVGFITRKDGVQSHDVLVRAHEALCSVPHRGGISPEGVGDGGGVSVDLSEEWFRHLTGDPTLTRGSFGVGNFFVPVDPAARLAAEGLIAATFAERGIPVLLTRDIPVDNSATLPAAVQYQLPLQQWVFGLPDTIKAETATSGRSTAFDRLIHTALLAIEAAAYTDPAYTGLYPVSLSARTQVLKGRLSSNEVISYFPDLLDPKHSIHTVFFHTRFSTNTDPHPTMAQPFRFLAHNGELNTDKKNRIAENAIARAKDRVIVRPKGQSDSCRLDQTLQSRILEDDVDLVTSVVAMMPPAWENDHSLSPEVRAMLEYFSLGEEKNDGPAALVFGDGTVIGARLDRLGLRPLRTVETAEYLCAMSEAGQIDFPPETVIRRGRIKAGGMLYFDHSTGRSYNSTETLEDLASRRDYAALLDTARVPFGALPLPSSPEPGSPLRYEGDLALHQRYVAYANNQESFKFLMDPMLATGQEKISAMGYGNAINALSHQEGGLAKFFSQRFAQVTNPPLDSIREADSMTLRIALGAKPGSGATPAPQIVVDGPILDHRQMLALREQQDTPLRRFGMFYRPDTANPVVNAAALEAAIESLCDAVEEFARTSGGLVVLTDRNVNKAEAALPLILAVSAVNQRLVDTGLRLRASIIAESGQISSAHHVSTALGFGASAVYPISVRLRAEEKFAQDPDAAFGRFVKAAQKSLMKTMGRVGLCTVESYIAGEFFEPNYLNTNDPVLARYFPEVHATVGGVGFAEVAAAVADWHATAITVASEADIPLLGLFKERSEGAGHSFGTVAVRGFVEMTEETLALPGATEAPAEQANEQDTESATVQLADPDEALRLLTLGTLDDAFGLSDKAYRPSGFGALSKAEIDAFPGTRGYADFVRSLVDERTQRPSSLRDVLAFPADVTGLQTSAQFQAELARFSVTGNTGILVRGLTIAHEDAGLVRLTLTSPHADDLARLGALADALVARFGTERGVGIEGHWIEATSLVLRPGSAAAEFLALLATAPDSVDHTEVQPASEITRTLASGAMSHGALVAPAHEAVAHGTNMVGGMSNSGEGGEAMVRYGTIRGSRIKQFASGRFGVWAGYLADPMLQELEIKIGQGAKPGEGGQLPAPKVTVEIAAARGATPGVELVSPPPHHDTYSIEDLAQLIHDCKAARVRVVVKLVSSEGIGTIAVGVAKAGADVINVAGNTGGTGAAAVTSLKYAGRSAEIGIAEVHQALCATGLRQKVILRCSGAHQTAADVVKSALLGGDSFEFGTTALMMLGCVMAKNCNVKCPAGLTTNAEAFDGDPRDLAQYLLNIAHDVRRVLARLGLRSLREARGRSELLHLINHPAIVGDLDVRRMLTVVPEMPIDEPVYMEPGFRLDDAALPQVREALFERGETSVSPVYHPGATSTALGNLDKTVGGQLAIDIERLLNHEWPADSWPSDLDPHATPAAARGQLPPSVLVDDRGRRYLAPNTITIETTKSAGQSYGAFCNDGMSMRHVGTCNDGVGKGASGGVIAVCSPGGGSPEDGGNVLIGNFALFGATGGRTFIEGQAGDRFAVRNSGASAVVEGVGDFACEYMTGGAVLNLGGFGKGFGNGMSGGFLYQYDPAGTFAAQVSADSIDLHPLVPEDASSDPMAAHHHDVVHRLLLAHFDATGSSRAAILLADWETVRHDFVYGMPRALLQYQDADEILAAKSRKELAEELSAALAGHQLRSFKLRYKDGTPVHAGVVPAYGTADTTEMYALLGSYTVLNLAQQLALTRVSGATDASDPRVQKAVRNLVLTEDFLLMHKLQRYAREALVDYSDAELAVLVSHKRLTDFKESLRRRNVLTSDSPGTLAWILHQDAKNRAALGHLPSFDELFAHQAVPDLALQAVVAR